MNKRRTLRAGGPFLVVAAALRAALSANHLNHHDPRALPILVIAPLRPPAP